MNSRTGVLTAMLLASSTALCQAVPHLINLEGRLTDPNGNPITVPTGVEFRLYQGGQASLADDGALIYREMATINPGSDGTYSYLIGGGSAVGNTTFNSADFDTTSSVFLQIDINSQPMLPRMSLVSTPYSLEAETVVDGAITTTKLAAGAVTNQQLSTGAVTSANLDPSVSGYLVPVGAIMLFASDCPSGWLRFTNLDGLFPRGADPGTLGGTTGGSATHTHTLGLPTSVENNDWLFGSPQGSGSHPQNFALADHVHSVSTESNLPPYLNVVFCQKQP